MRPAKRNEKAKPPKRRRATTGARLEEVARLAGVSPITVSRVINKPELVTEGTRRTVQAAIAKIAYVPNLTAGSLASQKTRLIAAVFPTIAHSIFSETIQGLSDRLADSGYQLVLGVSGYGASREDALVQTILARRPDGVLLTGVVHSEVARRFLVQAGIPVVETWDLTKTPIDMLVGFSHYGVGQAMAKYFLRRGYRRPAVISADDQRATARAQGFLDTLRDAGMSPPSLAVAAPSSLEKGRRALRELAKAHPKTDAVFCGSDIIAAGALLEAQASGVRVPKQLAVAGFADMELAAQMTPSLTTVSIEGYRIGTLAAEMLLERIGGGKPPEPVLDTGFRIIERESA